MKPRRAAALALVFSVLCFLSSACGTTTSDDMKKWVDAPESRLLASWGAPDNTAALPDGGKVDTWVTSWNIGNDLHTCRKTFTVDSEGRITNWSDSDCDFDGGLMSWLGLMGAIRSAQSN